LSGWHFDNIENEFTRILRYSIHHKEETRRRIVDEASHRLRKDGIEGTGLAPLMHAVGLTHGAFYAHFASKHALVEAALDEAISQTLDHWPEPHDAAQLNDFVDGYLSTAHRDNPADGCPLPSLAAELGLRGTPSAATDALVERFAGRLEPSSLNNEGGKDEERGLAALAAIVGALSLARAVADPALSDRILQAVHAALKTPDTP